MYLQPQVSTTEQGCLWDLLPRILADGDWPLLAPEMCFDSTCLPFVRPKDSVYLSISCHSSAFHRHETGTGKIFTEETGWEKAGRILSNRLTPLRSYPCFLSLTWGQSNSMPPPHTHTHTQSGKDIWGVGCDVFSSSGGHCHTSWQRPYKSGSLCL